MNKNKLLELINTDNFFLKFSGLLVIIYLLSISLNLNFVPLSAEEPRRILVALEMLLNNNYTITTIFNEVWYDHPPLWNIVLAFSAKLFGTGSEFAYRFPCALSLFLTGLVIFFSGKKYVSLKFGILSAFFYLISVDVYFFFSATAEIDIFFSLLTLLSILCVFHFHEKQNYYLLFLATYFFGTLGFFTKGIVALVFIGITLLTYFIYKREFKKLFSIPHIIAFCLCICAIVSYFYWYSLQEDVFTYIKDMWSLTQNKTVASGNPILGLIKHLFTFPINLVANLFPATLLLLFVFNKKAVANVKSHKYIYFLVLIFIFNFLIYWFSGGAKMRYTYMFYPMVISVFVYVFTFYFNQKSKLLNIYYRILQSIMALICAATVALPFIDYLSVNKNIIILSIIFGIAFITVFFLTVKTKSNWNKNLAIIAFFILTRLLYTSVVYPIKGIKSSSAAFKTNAKEIFEITKGQPIYLFSQESVNDDELFEIPFKFYRTGAYLEMFGTKISKVRQLNNSGYYIMNNQKLPENEQSIYSFEVQGEELNLVHVR